MATTLEPTTTYVGEAGAAEALIAQSRRDLAGFNPTDRLVSLGGGGGRGRGGLYLEVKWRIVWLRQEHPDATIATELHTVSATLAIFKAHVSIPGGGAATGWGSETATDFRDYIEKAETKAIGRALAALGYGTQFTGDEGVGVGGDHGEGHSRANGDARIADSPVHPDAGQRGRANGLPAGRERAAAQRPPPESGADARATAGQLRAVASLVRDRGIRDERGPDDAPSELEALALTHCGQWDYRQMTRQQIATFLDTLRLFRRAEQE
jgi:hypothetical protein